MALGPELVFVQADEISREFARNRVRRASAGDSWMALVFSRDRALLFSWDAESYGACRVTPEEIRTLEGASASRPPVLDAARAHIAGSDLCGASQVNRDRVMDLEFRREIGAGFFQTRHLIFEACGRYSNIIILDEGGAVVEAAKHITPVENRYRVVIPGSGYAPPPIIDGVPLDDVCVSGSEELKPDNIRGIGKPLIGAMKKLPGSDVRAVLSCLKNPVSPCYQILPSGGYVTFAHEPLPGAKVLDSQDALSAARAAVVQPMIGRRVVSCRKKISSLLNAAERANDRKVKEYETLASGYDEIERLRSEGRLILENAHAIPRRAASATLTEWTDAGPAERKIALDPEKDASGNAEARFAKYRRKKSAVESSAAVLPKLYKVRDELREQRVLLECNDDWNSMSMMLDEFETANKGGKPRGRQKGAQGSAAPHKRVEFPEDGAAIFCGLSARGNRYVTFKLAKADDLWLHAQDIPGAHVILRFDARPDAGALSRMLGIAASCAVYYSGGRDAGNIRVDYAERRHVRAIQGEGIANVTYKEFKTITADSSLWKDFESKRGSPGGQAG
ncbi:MAG: NFACT family protein [Synergistaceae bacterium]|nr:NFACT family protein [Synergistaceae bacterium]